MAAVIALAAAALGFAGAAVALALQLGRARAAEAKLNARVESLLEQHGRAVRELGVEAAAHVDTRTRLERVIAQKDAEITSLVEDLDAVAVQDPSVVVDRLRRVLLGGAAATADHAAPAAAGVRPAAGPGVGPGEGGLLRGRR